jgi:hypothetical protein
MAPGDRCHGKLEEHDHEAVQRHERAERREREAVVDHVERQRALLLEVDERAQQGRDQEEQERTVGAHGSQQLAGALVGAARAYAFGEKEECSNPEGGRAGRLDDEEEEERPLRQEAGRERADGEADVDRQPVQRIRSQAAGGRDDICEERCRGGAVELGREPGKRRQHEDDRERLCLGEREHRGGSREHGDRGRVAPPNPVGEVPAQKGRGQRAEAVRADRGAGLRRRVTLLGQPDDEEDEHEAPEAVDERPAEQHPGCRRHCADVVPDP